jgi:2-desacetyl-2-hydroxyethyl bacteriochlorophyllide A dehydrogenase
MTALINTRLMVLEPGQVELQEEALPAAGPNQILIRNRYTTMNLGTEMAIYNGAFRPGSWWQQNIFYPKWAGWGCLGRVVEVGPQVEGFSVGDRVVADGRHGAYFLTEPDPANGPMLVPAGITDDQASLWSLSRVSMHGVRVAALLLGESAAVVGLGIIGQLAVRFAHASGARPLIAVDTVPARLALAGRGGAQRLLEGPLAEISEPLIALTGGRRLDCLFDVTGNPDVIAPALKLVRMRGRYVLLGSPRGVSQVDFHDDIHFGVDVLGAQWNTYPQFESPHAPWTAARHGQLYFDLVESGRIDVDGLISHTVPWRDAPAAYREVQADRTRFMAVRFDWGEDAS